MPPDAPHAQPRVDLVDKRDPSRAFARTKELLEAAPNITPPLPLGEADGDDDTITERTPMRVELQVGGEPRVGVEGGG